MAKIGLILVAIGFVFSSELIQLIFSSHVHLPEEDMMAISANRKDSNPNMEDFEHEGKPLTFMASASGLDKENMINSRISMYYNTDKSDLNEQNSEVISHNGNPSWQKVFKFMHYPGKNQTWRFKVKDIIAPDNEMLLGEAVVNVDTYVKHGEILTANLIHNGEVKGKLIIRQTALISFKLSAKNLAKKDTFGGKSDPYVLIYWRRGPDGPDVQFAKTSQINNVVDAEWMDLITFEGYQKGTEQYWHFKLYDEDGFTSDDFLGEAFVNVDKFFDNLRMRNHVKTIELVNEGKRKGGKGSLSIASKQIDNAF